MSGPTESELWRAIRVLDAELFEAANAPWYHRLRFLFSGRLKHLQGWRS